MQQMLRMMLFATIATGLVFIMTAGALAYTGTLRIPPEGVTQTVTLTDGSKLVGKTTMITAEKIEFQTQFGLMSILIEKIADVSESKEVKEVKPVEETKKVEVAKPVEEVKVVAKAKDEPAAAESSHPGWFPNPNSTRLLIAPNARPLKAGKGYFFDLWIFFPGLAYGITDNISVSGGISIIPGIDNQFFYFIPKVGFAASDQVDLAASLMIFRIWNETLYFGLGNMTFGTEDASLTGGLGLAWSEHGMMKKPAGTLGGEYRLAARLSVVGEGWFVPGENENGMLLLGGLRFLSKEMTFDFGVATSSSSNNRDDSLDPQYTDDSDDETDFIPYIDFVWNF